VCIVESSFTYRSGALASEQRASEASNSAIKTEWENLAIQYHLIAHIAAELRWAFLDLMLPKLAILGLPKI
jgi:hypothetical protein